MEKSTEPNESKQEEGINEASEIRTSQEEQVQIMEPQTVPEVKPIKTQLNFDTLELVAYADILKKMIHADDWSKKGNEIKELISQFDNRFGKIFVEKKKEHIVYCIYGICTHSRQRD